MATRSRHRVKRSARRLLFYSGLLGVLVFSFVWMIPMPGTSYHGLPHLMNERETQLKQRLQQDVERLAGAIGERHLGKPAALQAAEEFLKSELKAAGYDVREQNYRVQNQSATNLDVEIRGQHQPNEIVIVGAHYDSAAPAPGADDNASGVAGVLALARAFAFKKTSRTLRFALFTNEEPPHFWSEAMGSLVYAQACKSRRENVVAMLALESIGYFRDEAGTQKYPFPINLFYPDRGSFIGFVGNLGSRSLTRSVVRTFRNGARIASEGAVLPSFIPGVGWSDQWSFWKLGYPAVMVTDTAPFRNPHYHTRHDTPETLDYTRFAEVVLGLERAVSELSG